MVRPRKEIVQADGIRPKKATLFDPRGRVGVVSRETALRLYRKAETCTDDPEERAIFRDLIRDLSGSSKDLVEMKLLLRKDAE